MPVSTKCQIAIILLLMQASGPLPTFADHSAVQAFQTPSPPAATLKNTTYLGQPAYRMTDGAGEAVISATTAHVLRFAKLGGSNWLWNAPPDHKAVIAFNGWGGNKTWLAPQSLWSIYFGHPFPPDPAWDGPDTVTILPGPCLRMTGPVSAEGVRLTRDFSFQNGEFAITQTAEKVSGCPLALALWSDTQVAPCEAVYLPLNPTSIYQGQFVWMPKPKNPVQVTSVAPDLLRIAPEFGGAKSNFYKIATDAPVAAILAVQGNEGFLERIARGSGDYADSAPGGGLAVQYFHHGKLDPLLHYDELELLTPLLPFTLGQRWTSTVYWSLHPLPGGVGNEGLHPMMEALLGIGPSSAPAPSRQ